MNIDLVFAVVWFALGVVQFFEGEFIHACLFTLASSIAIRIATVRKEIK